MHKSCITSDSMFIQDIAVWCGSFFFFLLLKVTEVENDVMSPVQEEEGPNTVSQLARKVCTGSSNFIFGTFYIPKTIFKSTLEDVVMWPHKY